MLTLKENMKLVYNHQIPEYMPAFSDIDQILLYGPDFVNERPEIPGVHDDWFGQSWTYVEDVHAASPTPNKPLLDDITRWKEVVKFPDLDKLDWEGHAKKDTANWDRENKMCSCRDYFGLWERMNSIMNFDEALVSLVTEPECCEEFFAAVADHKIRLHDLAIEHYHPDIIMMHDDYGTEDRMFMSPDTWRELVKPHLKRIVDAVHAKGVLYEHHSCGYYAPIIPDLIEIGVDAVDFIQACNNPAEISRKYHDKLTLVGAIDNLYIENPVRTEEEIRESIRKTYAGIAPNGSFVPVGLLFGPNRTIAFDEMKKQESLYYGPRPNNDLSLAEEYGRKTATID